MQDPMSTLDLTASNVDGGRDDLIRCQLVEREDTEAISAIASMVPTSWKWISLTGLSWALLSASAMRRYRDIGANGFGVFQVVDDMMDIVEATVGVIVMMVVEVAWRR